MEYTFDDLLDITAKYLDQIDFTDYIKVGEETNVEDVKMALLSDLKAGKLPELPEPLEGDLFKAFDLWDFAVYIRNIYQMYCRIETIEHYYLSAKN